jgi:hypothetical protein
MGKRANEKRRIFFEDLKKSGKLDLRPKIKDQGKRKAGKYIKGRKVEAEGWCCIDKYGLDLPDGFKACVDCHRK